MAVATARADELGLEEKLVDPQTVAGMVRLMDRLEEINVLLDAVVSVVRRSPEIADSINGIVEMLRANAKENQGTLTDAYSKVSSLLNTETALDTLIIGSKVIRAMSQAWNDVSQAPPQRVGVMGFVRALGDPAVQPALGYLLAYAKRFAEEFGHSA
ncbi:MAG: DUF1641 domain-containing protein [Thermaerobacter sp.]|nr:DUF1641 domain-containing protein [Thermaerobacter sp.]